MRWSALLAFALATFVAHPAQAQPAPSGASTARAKSLFRAGASAYKAGNFSAAVQAFDQAHALDPKPAIRFSAAQALRRWYAVSEDPAHLVTALSYYREYLDEVKTGGRVLDASRAKNEIEILLAQLGISPGEPGEAVVDAVPVRRGTIMVDGPEVQGIRTTVNGKLYEGWPVFAELPPGRYAVRVEAPGYRVIDKEANAVAGQLTPVDAALEELPAKVTIRSSEDAEVIVDGRPMGRLPLSAPLELPSGAHRVVVGSSGYTVYAADVDLTRGQALQIDADLAMTGQRIAAWSFFVAAGLGAGAGIALSVVAVSARSDARELLDQAEAQQRPLTLVEGVAYNEALDRRDDFIQAAGATFSLTAVTAGVGLLLFLLDQPNLYEAAADEQAARGPRFDVGAAAVPPVGGRAASGGVVTFGGRF